MNPLLIEIHNADGIEWGVSFRNSNPESEDYFACKTVEDAKKLIVILIKIINEIGKKEYIGYLQYYPPHIEPPYIVWDSIGL